MLRSMAAARPDDPFPQYGVAMELRKRGEVAEATEAFRALVERHPDYVPAYLMFGTMLAEDSQSEVAIEVLDRGIGVARAAGDEHALSELQAARAELS